jgi:hypothetical protein
MKRVMLAAGIATLALSAPAAAQTPWLHIRVEEGGKQSRVHVNLPFSVVEAALKAAPDSVVSKGQLHLGSKEHRLSIADLRALWAELKAAGDADFVTVEEDDQKVRVSRKGEQVLVRVEKAGGQEEVHVEVPTAVVDALLAGEGEQADLMGALRELQKRRGDVVRVRDKDSSVRIWIDQGN